MSGLAKKAEKIRTLVSYWLPCAAEESGEHLRELYFSDEVFEGLWQTSIMIQFFDEKKIGENYTLPAILPDAKYGKPGAETRRGHTIAAQSCATGARNRRWRKASLPRRPVTARSHIAGIERGGDGHAASSFLRMAHALRTDFPLPLCAASHERGQNKTGFSFCHSERRGCLKIKISFYFVILRFAQDDIALFDNQILF